MKRYSWGFARPVAQPGHLLSGGPHESKQVIGMMHRILGPLWAFLSAQDADHHVYGRLFAIVHRARYPR